MFADLQTKFFVKFNPNCMADVVKVAGKVVIGIVLFVAGGTVLKNL